LSLYMPTINALPDLTQIAPVAPFLPYTRLSSDLQQHVLASVRRHFAPRHGARLPGRHLWTRQRLGLGCLQGVRPETGRSEEDHRRLPGPYRCPGGRIHHRRHQIPVPKVRRQARVWQKRRYRCYLCQIRQGVDCRHVQRQDPAGTMRKRGGEIGRLLGSKQLLTESN